MTNLVTIIFIINITYFYRYCAYSNFTFDQIIKYALHGETLYALLYLIWLVFSNKKTYIFFVPMYFSTIAKLTWLFTSKEKLNIDFMEEVALFQTKAEIFVIGYQLISIPYGGFRTLIELVFMVMMLRFKYSFHEKAQEAFKELHFVLDNMFKRTKIRPKYQKIVQILGFFGQIYGGSKQIIY